MGLFFYSFLEMPAYAQTGDKKMVINPETIDPLNKIGKGMVIKKNPDEISCKDGVYNQKETVANAKISEMLDGSPMEAMVEALNKRENEVASYLVAIAKKESDWGKHSPKKAGRECYNYWGYRGKEDTTDSGYSCFDSPSHAVEVVGDRIERLIDSRIDTPAKMVVWKCGSNCEAAGGQAAANKWISDVASYYNKLQG
ncbi:MAG: hypothetical protein Q8L11_00555 [Candidatus Moranbacteria bacterium]|nr:hypothetical protein [Candidatus Moranbacteria bacterium]